MSDNINTSEFRDQMNHSGQTDRNDGLQVSIYTGIAITDKVIDSPILRIYAPSVLPFMSIADPELIATRMKAYPTVTNVGGGTSNEEVITKNYIDAVYFGLHTNRELPPDVRKGEQVLLFRIHNTDTYFWISLGRDDNLRRGERIKLRASNDNRFQKRLEDENTYFLEIDTLLHKHVIIQTSKSDDEKYMYRIKIDAVENFLHLSDDAGNEIIIESNKNRVFSRSGDGAFTDINGPDVHIHAERQLLLSALEIHKDCRRETKGGSRRTSNRIPDRGHSVEFRRTMSGNDNVTHQNRITHENFTYTEKPFETGFIEHTDVKDDRKDWSYSDYTNRGEGGVDAAYMRHYSSK